ncbi:MAG: TetR/AcrR family transcriptional regulator [Labilithrix sp.]|nr:TetR/AcrR family transcriptional regulator [Labilithrix sp.]
MASRSPRAGSRKKPQQERSIAMVETLLEAAARVFVKEGYGKATTNRIAAAAGVSVGSLYQYFPSKDAIAVELLRRYREGLMALIGARLGTATPETFEEVVHDLLAELVRAEGINPALHRVLIEQVLRTTARREMVGFEERLEAILGEALERAGIALPDRELAAFVLVRVVLAVVQGAVVDRPRYKTPALVDELTFLVVAYVKRKSVSTRDASTPSTPGS